MADPPAANQRAAATAIQAGARRPAPLKPGLKTQGASPAGFPSVSSRQDQSGSDLYFSGSGLQASCLEPVHGKSAPTFIAVARCNRSSRRIKLGRNVPARQAGACFKDRPSQALSAQAFARVSRFEATNTSAEGLQPLQVRVCGNSRRAGSVADLPS